MVKLITKKRLEMLELRSTAWEKLDDFLSQSALHWLFFPIRKYSHGVFDTTAAMFCIKNRLEEYIGYKNQEIKELTLEVEKLREENKSLKHVIEIKKEAYERDHNENKL